MRSGRVNWSGWTDEAFRKAQAEDKPVLLFLGANWCPGSRRMDETTFSDPEVAGLLDRDYVAVRVDADRRPDLDERYNLDGIPTTAFLTPAGSLMAGAAVVPAEEMKQLLVQLKIGYATQKHRIEEEIARREEKIARLFGLRAGPPAPLGMEVFRKTVRGILGTFDTIHAGFGHAPKFPAPASLRVILQALHESGGPDLREVLVRTLDAVGDRGMYDAVEGGFFRCAMNDTWTSARFEKRAAENAPLIALFLDASIVTGRDKYRDRALHAIAWVKKRLLDADRGVFFGSQAADADYYSASPRPEPPAVDRTIFVPSSAAMASAFLRASEVLGDPDCAATALRGLEWLLRECLRPEGVAHYHDGEPRFFELAQDPVALASALLDAHDHEGGRKWLDAAVSVMEILVRRFWSEAEAGIVDRVPGAIGALARPRKLLAENAIAASNFLRLAQAGVNGEHRERAERILGGYPDLMGEYGHATAEFAMAVDRLVRSPEETSNPAAYVPRRAARRP